MSGTFSGQEVAIDGPKKHDMASVRIGDVGDNGGYYSYLCASELCSAAFTCARDHLSPRWNFAQVIIIGEGPIGFSEVKTAQPFDFSLTIPANIRLGTYQLTASGATGPGTGVDSSPITLRVEKPGPVLQLSVQPTQIHFESEGEQMPLRVIGTFSDGTTDITESSRTTYTSNDVDVAKVSETGVVTAVGPLPPGTTEVTTEIVVSHGDQSVVVPVIFRPAKAP
ncbi:MAG: Ig-like domain-containing protein [Candidatus Methylomirabilales bacterium]